MNARCFLDGILVNIGIQWEYEKTTPKNDMSEDISKCDGCKTEISDSVFEKYGDDESKRIHYVDNPISPSVILLCQACHKEWSDVPKGFRLEVNPSTGGLWYRPLNQKEKSAIRSDKVNDPGFLIGWWVKGSIIVLIILAIAQFL